MSVLDNEPKAVILTMFEELNADAEGDDDAVDDGPDPMTDPDAWRRS